MIDDSPNFCPAIVVMVKTPHPGKVKTRLQPFLTAEQSASLAACFMQDTVLKVRKLTANIIIGFAPAGGQTELQAILGENLLWAEQIGDNLGERIESVIGFAESNGFGPIITIGTDSPSLPVSQIQTAIEYFRSKETELVLGPSADGGYYLIGLRKSIPGIFENILWSSPTVFEQTVKNAESAGVSRIKKLSIWDDVDTPQDLFSLRNELINNPEIRSIAPLTYEWLTVNDLLFNSRR